MIFTHSNQVYSVCNWPRGHPESDPRQNWGGQNSPEWWELGLSIPLSQGPGAADVACGSHAAMDSRTGALTPVDQLSWIPVRIQALN